MFFTDANLWGGLSLDIPPRPISTLRGDVWGRKAEPITHPRGASAGGKWSREPITATNSGVDDQASSESHLL